MNKYDQGKRSQTMVDTNDKNKDIQDYKFKYGFIILTFNHKGSIPMFLTTLEQK